MILKNSTHIKVIVSIKFFKLLYTSSSPFLHMPYSTIAEAKKAGFPTSAEGVDLTLSQISKLVDIYDAIKNAGTVDVPMAAAWIAWKKIYVKKGGKWVLKEKAATAENFSAGSWIKVAKKDQIKKFSDGGDVILTEVALKKTAASFKGKDIIINHKVAIDEPKILDARYISPFLQMFFDEEAAKLFRDTDSTGWSVQYDPDSLVFDGNKIIDGVGVGIGLLYGDHSPVCTPEMGCQEQNYTFETYTDFEETIDGEGIKKELERIWTFLKGTFGAKNIKKEEKDQDNNKKNLDKRSKMENEEKLTSELKTVNDELTKTKSEFETVKTEHDKEVKELKDKVATFEKEKEGARTAKINADWEQLKKTVIPKGLVHKEEDEKNLKAQFEQKPHEFMMKMVEFEKHEETGEEGAAYETKGANEVEELKKETWG